MFPAYIDPIAPGLVPAFAGALRAEFAWVAVAGLVGVLAVVALVVREAYRTRKTRTRAAVRVLPIRHAA